MINRVTQQHFGWPVPVGVSYRGSSTLASLSSFRTDLIGKTSCLTSESQLHILRIHVNRYILMFLDP